jgi:hypothetical protein
MIRHIVLLHFAAGTTADQVKFIATGIRSLPATIPELVSVSCGPDAGLATGNAAFAIVADFADEAGYLTYAAHPAHLEVIRDLIRPVVTQRTAMQYRMEA